MKTWRHLDGLFSLFQTGAAAFSKRGSRIVYTVADQGLFSGANFVLNLMLIRALSPSDYGQFTLAFVAFLIVSGLHNSLVLEPLSIIGSTVAKDSFATYSGQLLVIHFFVCVGLTGVMALATLIIPFSAFTRVFLTMAMLLTALLLPWLFRRLCYVQSVPHLATVSSGVYFAVLVTSIGALSASGHINANLAFVALGGASIVASVIAFAWLPVRPVFGRNRAFAREVLSTFREHWSLGKWVSLQGLFYIGSAYLPVIVAGMSVSVAASGILRAIGLVNQPVQQAMTAVGGLLILPGLSRTYAAHDYARLHRQAQKLTLAFLIVGIAHVLVLVVFKDLIVEFLPATDDLATNWLVPLVGVSVLFATLGSGAGLALRASRRVLYYPLSTIVPGVLGLLITPWLIIRYGVTGGVLSGTIVALAGLLVNIALYLRWLTPSAQVTQGARL